MPREKAASLNSFFPILFLYETIINDINCKIHVEYKKYSLDGSTLDIRKRWVETFCILGKCIRVRNYLCVVCLCTYVFLPRYVYVYVWLYTSVFLKIRLRRYLRGDEHVQRSLSTFREIVERGRGLSSKLRTKNHPRNSFQRQTTRNQRDDTRSLNDELEEKEEKRTSSN